MKKLAVVVVAIALALPVVAMGAGLTVPAGKYEGKVAMSVLPDLSGKPMTMEVKNLGTKTVATVEYAGGKEVWTWDDKTLDQQEIDVKSGKTLMTYGATATAPAGNNKQTYFVNCKDKAKNECDAGSDSRFNWELSYNPTTKTYSYIVNGVDKDKKNDATVKAAKRHEFVLTLKSN